MVWALCIFKQVRREKKKDCKNWRLVKRLTEWSRRGVDGRRRTWGKVRAVLAEKKTGGPVVSELEGRHSQRGSLAVSK